MKLKIAAFLSLSLVFAACQQDVRKSDLKTQQDSVSYAIGLDVGRSVRKQVIDGLKKQSFDINDKVFLQGIKDAVKKDSSFLLTETQIQKTIMNWQKDMMSKQAQSAKQMGEKNKKEGDNFLAANKNKEGVKTTASGLQYKIIKSGNGPSPKAEDKVVCNYRGTLVDGTEFDNSAKRGGPATFPVTGVIPGWTEAIQMMKVGDKWQLFIPASLAYGEQGMGQQIPPNSTLIFEIELLSISK